MVIDSLARSPFLKHGSPVGLRVIGFMVEKSRAPNGHRIESWKSRILSGHMGVSKNIGTPKMDGL